MAFNSSPFPKRKGGRAGAGQPGERVRQVNSRRGARLGGGQTERLLYTWDLPFPGKEEEAPL